MIIRSATGKLLHVERYAKARMFIFGLFIAYVLTNAQRVLDKKLFLQEPNGEGIRMLMGD
jgi:hypothetical protein